MRFFLSVISVAALSALVELIMPWWSVAIVALIVSLLIAQRPGRAFFMGFAGVGLCWLIAALMHDVANEHILATRMAMLFKLPNYGLFILVTVVIGGLVGGLASWAGALLKPKV